VSTVTPTQGLAVQLLTAIGAPSTTSNVAAMMAWLNSESTHTASTLTAMGNNPLNVSTGADVSGKVVGTTAVGPGIAQYASLATGVQATAQYLQARQPGIVAGFKTGNGTAAVGAITASNYVTGGGGGNQYGGALLGRMQAVLPSVTAGPNVLASAPSATAGTAIGAVQTEIATLQGYINNIQAVPSSKRSTLQSTELTTYTARLTAARATLQSLLTTGIVSAGAATSGSPQAQHSADSTSGLPGAATTAVSTDIGAWYMGAGGAPLVSFPAGHVMTQADVNFIMTQLKAAGVFANDPLGAGESKTAAGLQQFVGAAWTNANIGLIAGAFGAAASQTPGTNTTLPDPIAAIGTALTGLGTTFVTIATYLAALVVVGLGIFLYTKGGNKEAQVATAGY
jgi:hypothetical protein